MISHYVDLFFHEFLKDKFGSKPEIYNFLIRHERKGKCLDGIAAQIRMAEFGNLGARMDLGRLKKLTHAGARMFCDAALKHAEEQILSRAERQRRIDKSNELENLQADLIDKDIIIATNDKPEKFRCN